MCKRYLHFFIVILVIGSPFLSSSFCSEKPDAIKKRIEKYFNKVDSLLVSIASEPEMRMKEVKLTDSLFEKNIEKHSFLHALIRTNSRGVLVNEVIATTEPGQRYRDVSQENWYSVPAKTLKPYYSPITTANNKIVFIWSKPLFIQKSSGENRFGGIVAAQIDIRELLNRVAKRFHGSAQCLYKNRVFFQFSWRKSNTYNEYPIVISGKEVFTVQSAVSGERIEKKVSSPSSDSAVYRKRSDTKGLSSYSTDKEKAARKSLNRKKSFPFILKSSEGSGISLGSRKTIIIILCLTIVFILVLIFAFRTHREVDFEVGKEVVKDSSDDGIAVFEEKEHKEIEIKERDTIKKQELDETQEDIKGQIIKSERDKLTAEVREEIKKELYDKIRNEEEGAIRESIKSQIEEFYIDELKGVIHKQVREEYREKFEKEARENLQNEIKENIQREEAERIEKETLQNLKGSVENHIKETEKDDITREITGEIREKIRNELEESEKESIRAEIRKNMLDEINEAVRKNEYDALYEQVKKMMGEEVREDVIKKDADTIRSQEREKLAAQIREELVTTQKEDILKHEREIIRQDAAAIIKNNEYTEMLERERDRVREDIHKRLADEDSASIEAEERKKLIGEIGNEIRAKELETIANTMRKEMAELVQKELDENEKDQMYTSLKKKLVEEIQHRIEQEEKDVIRIKVYEEIKQKEKKRLQEDELTEIIENEKKRIAQEEYKTLRTEALKHIHDEEMPTILEQAKEEIYSETVDDLKTRLTEKIKASFNKTMIEKQETLKQDTQDEFRKSLQEEYHYLIGIVGNMDNSLKNIEALNSLRHTITRLLEEKSKYKFFNLNAAQTESIIEYLQRLQGNFDAYFDGLDNTLQAVKIKVNSILNSLGEGNAIL